MLVFHMHRTTELWPTFKMTWSQLVMNLRARIKPALTDLHPWCEHNGDKWCTTPGELADCLIHCGPICPGGDILSVWGDILAGLESWQRRGYGALGGVCRLLTRWVVALWRGRG